jgi:hypothetical protein
MNIQAGCRRGGRLFALSFGAANQRRRFSRRASQAGLMFLTQESVAGNRQPVPNFDFRILSPKNGIGNGHLPQPLGRKLIGKI